jgi:hypothetical protein
MSHWKLQIRVIAAYGKDKGKEVWQTLVEGPGYRENAEAWVSANTWVSKLGNLKLIVECDNEC